MSHGDVTGLVYGNRRLSSGSDGGKVRAFRRSRERWSVGPKVAFSGSYLSMAALLRQQGVERLGRSSWGKAKRSLAGLRRVLQCGLLHEALDDLHRRYVGRSLAMAVHRRIVQLVLTSRPGREPCGRSDVAWHALNGYDGWWRKSWRCNGRRSRWRAGRGENIQAIQACGYLMR